MTLRLPARPELHFLGAANEVTGSMHLLATPAGTVLIDCGLYQGRRDDARRRNTTIPAEARAADAMLLSHAHIDHSGNIPGLIKQGFRGDVWATPATRDLCAHMLRDSARIQMGDAEYLNRKHADDPDWKDVKPLYDEEDAIHALTRFAAMPYGRRFRVIEGVDATFLDAGHILGSAQIVIDLGPAATGTDKSTRLVFSGDLGRHNIPILRDPEIPPGPVASMLLESTYGNRVHGSIEETDAQLAALVTDVAKQGGKIVIPAFAVGRTQEVVFALHRLRITGRLPDVPVFIDSPLSVNVTDVFRRHPDCYDAETRQFLETHGDVFDFPGLRYVQSREESIRLNRLAGPAIIISASGMCESGRVVHHLKNTIEDPRNAVLIVGFQAQHTLGRRIVERRPRVRLLGVERELRARVSVMSAFSAHADRDDLLAFVNASHAGLQSVFLIHGEPDQQEPLLNTLRGRGLRAEAPTRGAVHALPV